MHALITLVRRSTHRAFRVANSFELEIGPAGRVTA